MNYYNEFDPKAAAWLRELIRGGHIADGVVDERSILDVKPEELAGYVQCHFFAGIGGWSYALRLAGVADDEPVWTGSCPCQPLSSAGKQLGHADERHLWPAFHDLIAVRRPAKILGEQVASSLGREWFAGVRADMEALGYACGGADLCSAGVGEKNHPVVVESGAFLRELAGTARRTGHAEVAERLLAAAEYVEGLIVGSPNIRQRLYWVAHANGGRFAGIGKQEPAGEPSAPRNLADGRGELGRMANTDGRDPGAEGLQRSGKHGQRTEDDGARRMGDANSGGSAPGLPEPLPREEGNAGVANDSSGARGFWDSFDLLPCTDGKARRIEPGTFPLAHGVSGRVGLLRGYGNAINPWQAALFIKAAQESLTP